MQCNIASLSSNARRVHAWSYFLSYRSQNRSYFPKPYPLRAFLVDTAVVKIFSRILASTRPASVLRPPAKGSMELYVAR